LRIFGATAAREADRQQQEAKKEQQKIDRKNEPKVANARNNWLSVGYITPTGGGIKYERMLNKKLSLGIDAYLNADILSINPPLEEFRRIMEIGLNAAARFYPWGKSFYVGVGLGGYGFAYDVMDEKGYPIGLAITPELGFRIDLGYAGGFFMDIGVRAPQMFCSPIQIKGKDFGGYFASIVPYIGVFGWAF